MYKFMTLADDTEIVHSEVLPDNNVKVYIEKPDDKDTFHSMVVMLPRYDIREVDGFTNEEIDKYVSTIKGLSHVIMRLAARGGFEYAEAV